MLWSVNDRVRNEICIRDTARVALQGGPIDDLPHRLDARWPRQPICDRKTNLLYVVQGIGEFKISRHHTTVANMALEVGIDPDRFGAALRKAKFPPRKVKRDWEVKIGSDDYSAMRSVLVTLFRRTG